MNKADKPIGYGHPPAEHRFQPGQSGNPSGRPKRQRTFWSTVRAELAKPVPGKDGEPGCKMEALVTTLVDSAIAGNARAQTVLIGALARLGEAEDNEAAAMTADDQELLDAFVGGE